MLDCCSKSMSQVRHPRSVQYHRKIPRLKIQSEISKTKKKKQNGVPYRYPKKCWSSNYFRQNLSQYEDKTKTCVKPERNYDFVIY